MKRKDILIKREIGKPTKYSIPVFGDNVKYEDWCRALGKDPSDDENHISWSEMRNNR
jgi:hypothetical protein